MMRYKFSLATLLIFILMVPLTTCNADSTVTFYPLLDVHLLKEEGLYGGGTDGNYLYVGEAFPAGTNTWYRAYLRFDVTTIPDNATIINATLILYYYSQINNNPEGDRALSEVTDIGSWGPDTWNKTVVQDYGVFLPLANITDYGFYDVDVSSSITPTRTFVSFRLNGTVNDLDGNYWRSDFASVNHANATIRPRLVVTILEGPVWDDYISWLINSAFSLFGIYNYMTLATTFVNNIKDHFIASLVGLATLINLQFQVIWATFTFFTTWATRIITRVLNIGTTMRDVMNGVATGTLNIWTYFSFDTLLAPDLISIVVILYWIDTVYKRGRTQGYTAVLWGDAQNFANVFSFFMTSFATVIGYIEGKIGWLFQALT